MQGSKAYGYDFVHKTEMSCGSLGCPTCYEKVCAKKAVSIENRISQFKWSNRKETKYFHWVVSPPITDPVYFDYDIESCRKRAYPIIEESGILGGSMIPHHLRSFGEGDIEESLDEGFSFKDAPAKWYFSPHFHILGVGFTSSQRVRAVFEKYGWVVKNLGERKSIRATAHYQLSHAYVPEGRKHCVTWFGLMSYSNFKCKPVPKMEVRVCPDCGCDLVEGVWVDSVAENIVKSIISRDGNYRIPTGLLTIKNAHPPPWFKERLIIREEVDPVPLVDFYFGE